MGVYVFLIPVKSLSKTDNYGSKKSIRTDSAQCVECLNHWLVLDIMAGASAELLTDGLMILEE